ncbi:MAG: hypothetical protein AAF391_04240 [Bacteroidota bacterium]
MKKLNKYFFLALAGLLGCSGSAPIIEEDGLPDYIELPGLSELPGNILPNDYPVPLGQLCSSPGETINSGEEVQLCARFGILANPNSQDNYTLEGEWDDGDCDGIFAPSGINVNSPKWSLTNTTGLPIDCELTYTARIIRSSDNTIVSSIMASHQLAVEAAQQVFVDTRNVIINGCSEEESKRISFAVRYLRAASTTTVFDSCLRTAVRKRKLLTTSHEIDDEYGQVNKFVGPYVPCEGGVEDPQFAIDSNRKIGYDIVMNLARQNTRKRRLLIECNRSSVPGTALSPEGGTTFLSRRWNYYATLQWTRFHEIWFNPKIFYQYPSHADGETIDPIFGDLGPSYPVDELSGIILHEMLHNVGFNHGVADFAQGSCGYSTNSGNGFNCGSTGTCRMNSLNEIAEACMSEVVQKSTDNCDPRMCTRSDEVPIYYSSGDCRCEKFW